MTRLDSPNESRELTVQHLDILTEKGVLSENVLRTINNAIWYVLHPENNGNEGTFKPILWKFGPFFGRCPKCHRPIRAIDHPHFCGHCGCHVEWEGWEEGS